MRISDWSSDVCSPDLVAHGIRDDIRVAFADEGAALRALLQNDDAGNLQGPQCFADCVSSDLELIGKGPLWRQFVSGLEDASAELRPDLLGDLLEDAARSEEHTSELQSLMRISYAVFCLTTK